MAEVLESPGIQAFQIFQAFPSYHDAVPARNVTRNKEEFDAKAASVVGKAPFAKFENILAFKESWM